MKKKIICTLHTDGLGLWSRVAKKVEITKIELCGSELEVHFNSTWNVAKNGLIYTDKLFEKELRAFLKKKKIVGQIEYSEQGMQGSDYVSFDYISPDCKKIKALCKTSP